MQSFFGAPARKPDLTALPAECLLVIDSGYSHSTVTPLYNGRPIQQAIRRLDVGGKFLTNYLKELISIRHYNMLDETYVMNEIKEAVCYVSEDFKRDLERTWKGNSSSRQKALDDERDIAVDYVLPDYNVHKSGFMRPHDHSVTAKMRKMGSMAGVGDTVEDYMTLRNERFMVPELLFNPGDVGMKQEGLPTIALQSLSGLPPGLWPAMLANILVVGGNSKIEGFMSRLSVSEPIVHLPLLIWETARERFGSWHLRSVRFVLQKPPSKLISRFGMNTLLTSVVLSSQPGLVVLTSPQTKPH